MSADSGTCSRFTHLCSRGKMTGLMRNDRADIRRLRATFAATEKIIFNKRKKQNENSGFPAYEKSRYHSHRGEGLRRVPPARISQFAAFGIHLIRLAIVPLRPSPCSTSRTPRHHQNSMKTLHDPSRLGAVICRNDGNKNRYAPQFQ